MPRFSEVVLLLVTFTLLPSLFVKGFQELIPTVKHAQRNAIIRGLLFSRDCIPGWDVCEDSCCPVPSVCCGDGSCCLPGMICVTQPGSNNVMGCCVDNGKVCTGTLELPSIPAPTGPLATTPPPTPTPPSTPTPPPSPPPSTPTPPPPPLPPSTPTPTPPPPPPTIPTQTPTQTTLLGVPTPSAGYQQVNVPVTDMKINYGGTWNLQTSSCDPSISSKITSTGNSFFTYLPTEIATSFVFYINVVNSNTEWEVFFNGVSQKTYFSTSSGFANCTYQSSNSIQSQKAIAPNITVLVHGSDSLSTSDSWSFEVNNMIYQYQDQSQSNSSSGSVGSQSSGSNLGPATSTPTSAAGRAHPYGALLVPGSILLAAVISILRL